MVENSSLQGESQNKVKKLNSFGTKYNPNPFRFYMINKNSKSAIIVGSGLGGLSTALRLSTEDYDVTVIEKHSKPGGRLNQLKLDGFTFDVGPSFMSMSWELEELFKSNGLKNPIQLEELDPLYQVYFEGENLSLIHISEPTRPY